MTTPNDPHNWSPTPLIQKVATLPVTGFPLVNGTPTILTWNVPNDGLQHQCTVRGVTNVASTATGGQVNILWTPPAGGAQTFIAIATSHAAGLVGFGAASSDTEVGFLVQAGSQVSIVQGTALTGGASTVYAEIWGS